MVREWTPIGLHQFVGESLILRYARPGLKAIDLGPSTGGVVVISTPNVDSLPTRLRFLQTGKIRMMDDRGEPTHISPIFFDLLQPNSFPLQDFVCASISCSRPTVSMPAENLWRG
jgi:hypothetical protein